MQAPEPQAGSEGQWAPSQVPPIIFDTFSGLNTAASRPGIEDQQMAWCDGFIPLGKNNLRTLYGVGDAIYTAPGGTSITWFDFANIGTAPICVAFLSNGAIIQINTSTKVATTIATAGTITSPASTGQGICQWGNQWIIIVANQANGYWIWDGVHLYTSGTVGPLASVVNSGLHYTSQPTFTLQTTGTGSGVSFSAVLNNDNIQLVSITNPGSGFGINDYTNLVITGGGSDSTASATAVIGPGGGIQSVAVLNGGEYTSDFALVVSGGGGSGAQLTSTLVPYKGGYAVQAIAVLAPGTGYTATPTLTPFASTVYAAGTFYANIFQGQITAANVTSGGSGYVTPPSISAIGNGTGATFQAEINAGGTVTAVSVTNGGSGYTVALLDFSGGNNAAQASVELMPFGIKGTDAETYVSRVWAVDGNEIHFTAPDATADFATSNGGGTIESTDSFLRNAYVSAKQTNGFLYLIADSSENYISGVTTSGVPPTTTFSNQNADPEIGTSWPGTVDVFSRNLVFGNSFGVHISYGGAVTKISGQLDGIYNTVPGFNGFIPSAAKAIIFGRKIWMMLLPIVDMYTGQTVNKLLMWDGKVWFTSQQDITLQYIASQELNSQLTAYGTDGTSIYPLFQKPSVNFAKVVQSKLWDKPGGYMFEKAVTRLWGCVYFYSGLSSTLNVSLDNENGTSIVQPVPATGPVAWYNALSNLITWFNAAGNIVLWYGSGAGVSVFQPDAVGQSGALVGLTLTTNAADMAVVSLAIQAEIQSYRG